MNEKEKYILTIAIPTFNRADFLSRSLNSILLQYDERVEILVSDNASTDRTFDFMSVQQENYKQIHYIRNTENIGPDANFLQCYRLAKGKFILLLGDDDIVIENSLKPLIDFLEESGMNADLVFLNHVFFQGQYHGLNQCANPFLADNQSFLTTDKDKFISVAKYQLTYMSSFVLQSRAFKRVENPERYAGTSFIHSCIAFEATQPDNTQFGVYGKSCIAQDLSVDNVGYPQCLYHNFRVFGKGMEYAYCEVAPQYGYSQAVMYEIFEKRAKSTWKGTILTLKAFRIKGWKDQFELYGRPVLEKHKRIKKAVLPYLWIPSWLAWLIYKCIRPIYKKIKSH